MRTSETITAIGPALMNAKKQMTAVEKRGFNQHDGYNYATLEDYMGVVRPCLESAGILLVTSAPQAEPIEGRMTANGKPQYACYITLQLRAIHAESGEWIEVTAQGEGQDRADKAIYKATTGARKYGVAMLFDLVTTDDPESDGAVGHDAQPPKKQQQAHQPTPADFI